MAMRPLVFQMSNRQVRTLPSHAEAMRTQALFIVIACTGAS